MYSFYGSPFAIKFVSHDVQDCVLLIVLVYWFPGCLEEILGRYRDEENGITGGLFVYSWCIVSIIEVRKCAVLAKCFRTDVRQWKCNGRCLVYIIVCRAKRVWWYHCYVICKLWMRARALSVRSRYMYKKNTAFWWIWHWWVCGGCPNNLLTLQFRMHDLLFLLYPVG